MKKVLYALFVPLVVISGVVFANRQINSDTLKKSTQKPLSAAEIDSERKKWEATPDGIKYKRWEASSKGQQVLADAGKIRKQVRDFTEMEAVVTSLSLPPGSRLGFGVMVKIDGVEYILNFEALAWQLEHLRSLQVNDKIVVKSRSVSFAPKYAYAIVSGEYLERDKKIIFARVPRKGGC